MILFNKYTQYLELQEDGGVNVYVIFKSNGDIQSTKEFLRTLFEGQAKNRIYEIQITNSMKMLREIFKFLKIPHCNYFQMLKLAEILELENYVPSVQQKPTAKLWLFAQHVRDEFVENIQRLCAEVIIIPSVIIVIVTKHC